MKKTLKELLTLNEPEKKKVKKGLVIALIISVTIIICYFVALGIYYGALNKKTGGKYVDRRGTTVAERFKEDDGFTRIALNGGRAETLRNFPLKNFGLAAYKNTGLINEEASLCGVIDNKKSGEPAEWENALAKIKSGEAPRVVCSEALPGDFIYVSKGDAEYLALIMDVARSGDGATEVLAALYDPEGETFILARGGDDPSMCWLDVTGDTVSCALFTAPFSIFRAG